MIDDALLVQMLRRALGACWQLGPRLVAQPLWLVPWPLALEVVP